MHGMNDLHRSVKDAPYTLTRPGTVLYRETLRSHIGVDEDYALLTGDGLRTFRRNAVHLGLLALKMQLN